MATASPIEQEVMAERQIEVATDLKLWRSPEKVLQEAQEAAVALQRRIEGKKKPVVFNGEQYIEFDDWEMVAHFFGYSVKVESTEPIQFEEVRGFKASAILLNERTGQIVSRAEAVCLNDEDKWSTRPKYESGRDGHRVRVGEVPVPTFQLLSMAQTRACAKACRNKLAWIVSLAGYCTTPSEEMNESTPPRQPSEELPTELKRKPTQSQPAQTSERPASPQRPLTPDPNRYHRESASAPIRRPSAPVKTITDGQARRFYAIWKENGKTKDEVVAYLKRTFGIEDDRNIPSDRYTEACAWAQRR